MELKRALPTPLWVAAAIVALVLVSPAAGQDPAITVSGEVRLRTETLRADPAADWDNFTLMRTRLGLLAAVNPNVRAFVQFQDSRAFGDQPSTMTGRSNAIDLHQGYLELGGTLAETPLLLRAGRQEIALGNERLVGAVGWSNTGRSFDGARLILGGRESRLLTTAFVATLAESHAVGAANGQTLDSDSWFGGIQTTWKGLLEGYALYDRNGRFSAFTDVDRATLGGRAQTPATHRLNASLEGAYQLGSQTAGPTRQDIRAWFAGGRVGAKTGVAALPSVGLGIDVLSGDASPTDDDYRAFNTLYATNHKFYGYLDLFTNMPVHTRNRGLVDLMGSTRAVIGTHGTLEIDAHRFLLADDAGLDARDLGWELDLTYPFRVANAGRVTIGYSVFRNGAAAPVVGLGEEGRIRHWGFVQAGVSF
jgi:hypothetical protein